MKHLDIFHNSFDSSYRDPFGAAPKSSQVKLSIDVHHRQHVTRVHLHYIFDKTNEEHIKEMDLYTEEHQYSGYEVMITMPEEPQLVWYFFEIETEDRSLYYGCKNPEESGEGKVYDVDPLSWQITVYDPAYHTPHWWKNATMYQIFPDRFHASGGVDLKKAPKTSLVHAHWSNDPFYIRNERGEVVRWDFFGGNLQGIIEKLDYIQSLGVTVIYLNPIFEAESNHRYDTGDYHKVDPLLGTKEDFEELITQAKSRGIEIMLDGVFSHTGSNSIYFNQKGTYNSVGAYQSKESPYFSWYTFHQYPDEYDAWWGVGTLPTVNKEDESYQQFLVHDENSVIKNWQRSGMNHWRLDVADELTDDLIRMIYKELKNHEPDSVLLGEVWEDASNKTAYGKRRDYFLGGVLDSVMNYPLRALMLDFIRGDIDAFTLHTRLVTLREHYPKEYFYAVMNMLSSHDVERIKTLLDEALPTHSKDERESIVSEQLKALSLWMYTFPGIPSLYYGDEAGVTGGEDPDNRKPYPWGKEDQTLLNWYKMLGSMRQEHQALRTGSWISHAADSDVYTFVRSIENGVDEFGAEVADEQMMFVFNRNVRETKDITLKAQKGRWQNIIEKSVYKTQDGTLSFVLSPSECMLLRRLH
ncbi:MULTISPECIES: glycoside hydrolase family 13 protein [Pontibacillus]|uniref:Glycoside hydrolase family 13 protein n=1 Tax=Pontibacillus chungwhensis TaxID=265426 RepID=A0ABY8UXZ9_9BACI|nr:MULTISPECIES: glycoside hydrolase family 13 protein [Pontibacillus]MCD5325675.1 glycoside hydrolase family 13 protein [Pontibacillus sp. HN14]WIF98083.1 glycoside hydrolase family 13 protein [Pontibacillus chungwhensis]